MTASRSAAGRVGGYTRAATAPTPQAITQHARDGRWARYLDQAREAAPGVTDEADIIRRAQLLRRADMCRLSQLAADARKQRAAQRAEPQIHVPEETTHEH